MRRHDMTKKKLQRLKTKTFWEHLLETCDILDTDYNSDNWESEFMTIFVTLKFLEMVSWKWMVTGGHV